MSLTIEATFEYLPANEVDICSYQILIPLRKNFKDMKKILIVSLALLSTGILFDGCKKGENDPFLTLSGRRARLAGDWKMTGLTGTFTSTDASGTDTDVISYDGTNITITSNGVASPPVAYSMSLSLEKKGGFTQTVTDAFSGSSQTQTTSGQWYFAGKNKQLELKNKEAIIFSVSSQTSNGKTDNYTGIYADDIYVIDQLKKKEMIVKSKTTSTYSDGTSDSEEMTMTFTQ